MAQTRRARVCECETPKVRLSFRPTKSWPNDTPADHGIQQDCRRYRSNSPFFPIISDVETAVDSVVVFGSAGIVRRKKYA
jgi:hypothetical protein